MDLLFGDVINCKNYSPIGHFIVVLGVDSKDRILYKCLSSRTYRAFEKLCYFFNDCCIANKCRDRHFHHHFKDKEIIRPVRLCNVFFIDKLNYPKKLDEDSMIMINSDPKPLDRETFNKLRNAGVVRYSFTLNSPDIYRLYVYVKTSEHISKNSLGYIEKSFGIVRENIR